MLKGQLMNEMINAVAEITFPDETTMALKVKSNLELDNKTNIIVGNLLPLHSNEGTSLTFTTRLDESEIWNLRQQLQACALEQKSILINKMLGRSQE